MKTLLHWLRTGQWSRRNRRGGRLAFWLVFNKQLQ
jgi:hypothetical protein